MQDQRGAERSRRWSAFELHMPGVYLVVVLALVAFLLPTVLRPPEPPPPSSAVLNPNAPPDPEVLITELNQGHTVTAGTGLGGRPAAARELPAVTQATAAPRACPHGFGNPPRQTFSLYSAPCAPAWSGSNGGATWKGVSATEVRVAVGWPSGGLGTEGPVAPATDPNQSDSDRSWTYVQQWFNSRYQFWGRQLRLYIANGTDDPQDQVTLATKIDEEYHAFAADEGRPILQRELARRKIVSIGEIADQYSDSFYAGLRPYVYGWTASRSVLDRHATEYVCSRLAGRPATHAGDGAMQGTPRVFGLVYNDGAAWDQTYDEIRKGLASCGVTPAAAIGFPTVSQGGSDTATLSTAIAKLRQAGVTTVVDVLDSGTTLQLTTAATVQAYSPEWFINGVGDTDYNVQGRLMDQTQWAHAFGLSALELDTAQTASGAYDNMDCIRALREVEPAYTPGATNLGCSVFAQLLQIANGIQMAGPHLTPETFQLGLYKMGMRGPIPRYSIGGGYAAGHWAYADAVGEVWWDASAVDDSGTPGAYRWTHRGQKWTGGKLLPETDELFRSGVARQLDAESESYRTFP